MAPSGYLQVGSPKQRGGIVRPGAVNLRLPLVERHCQANDSEENLLTLASSQWTISAAPISSASFYSQSSYINSPPVFSENTLDRRRFGIANTPAQEGPWSRPEHLQSAASSIFVLGANPFIGEDEEVDDREDIKTKLSGSPIGGLVVESPKVVPETNHAALKEATNARLKKLRMSTRVLGKMLSRLSIHQSSRHANTDEAPLTSPMPLQILISLPSSGTDMSSLSEKGPESQQGPEEDLATQDGLRLLVPERNTDIPRELRTRSSTWKPHRPPSPLPRSLRKRGKHMSEASALSHLVITSPPPPLPTRPKIASTVLVEQKPAFLSFSMPLSNTLDMGPTSPVWADIQSRLKARAMKSSTYAIHDGGIISPTSS
ncbi:hypothetical protein C0995_011934 [Termitomyces sp. Mi166|nr:hypothetical protein C0995_011934 [Termitomyces sp. Mi166\